jgi:hypothetical protein
VSAPPQAPADPPDVDRPIGWWLKHVDRLIEESFERVLAGEGIGRRHWQAVNAIAGGADSREALERALAPFTGGRPPLRVVLDLLRAKGWISEAGGTLTLTPAGAAARGRLVVAVRAARARITEGVSEQEYRAAIATLRRIAQNLT